MARLGDMAEKIRSKNAGPFWLTLDVFCGSQAVYDRVVNGLATNQVARLFKTPTAAIRRFDMPDLNVVKFSLPRPTIQGVPKDRDMHGASFAALLADIEV